MPPLVIPQLLRIMPQSKAVIAEWIGALELSMCAYDIDTERRAAFFLANVAHESSELTQLEENLRYTSYQRLLQVFPTRFTEGEAGRYVALGPEAIANRVYANRFGNGPESSGDGWRYRARGPGGVTFKDNYRRVSEELYGDETILLAYPELLTEPESGAASFAWYWKAHGCNELADADDFDGCCDMVNLGKRTVKIGDSNGYADRLAYLQRALSVFLPQPK